MNAPRRLLFAASLSCLTVLAACGGDSPVSPSGFARSVAMDGAGSLGPVLLAPKGNYVLVSVAGNLLPATDPWGLADINGGNVFFSGPTDSTSNRLRFCRTSEVVEPFTYTYSRTTRAITFNPAAIPESGSLSADGDTVTYWRFNGGSPAPAFVYVKGGMPGSCM